MLELGQPLHGFDLRPARRARRSWCGGRARASASTTLDDVERTLTAEDLLICDVERPVAIAGVMGGTHVGGVRRDAPTSCSRARTSRGAGSCVTARRLELHTEASHRFERGTDPEGLEAGAARDARP